MPLENQIVERATFEWHFEAKVGKAKLVQSSTFAQEARTAWFQAVGIAMGHGAVRAIRMTGRTPVKLRMKLGEHHRGS